ncbi:MAG: 3-methyl-2-oxobutanoate dehydrogenase subunit VorB [Aigarchaeota archaeon]|nr:3-methyl-2-oxobutanoate dehydrogenase subunit VorB [Aigarchaeota archaeon]
MSSKTYIKGNEAIAQAAIRAGCEAFFGYPITPSSEIPETLAKEYPARLRVFLQAESELAAINMVYGAACTGSRVMTASSSPGMSLKQEGISYLAGAELPAVIVNVNRAGPGLGNIGPEQSDYFQATRGGGHGGYRMIVLAPNSVQDMATLTMDAFELAERYRNPVLILTDAYLGQMKEDVVFPRREIVKTDNSSWAITGAMEREAHVITSIHLDFTEMERHVAQLIQKYKKMEEEQVRFEEYRTDDAELIGVAYGIVSRILKDTVDRARRRGMKVGMIRPITLWPFPYKRIGELAEQAKAFLTVELNTGQMVDDVRLAVNGRVPVYFHGRYGGNLPSATEVLEKMVTIIGEER